MFAEPASKLLVPFELASDPNFAVTEQQLPDDWEISSGCQPGPFMLESVPPFLQRCAAAVNRGRELFDRQLGGHPQRDVEGIASE